MQRLEKENRTLRKKLERAQRDLQQLEVTTEKKERLLRQALHDLRDSQDNVAARQQMIAQLQRSQSQLVHAEKMSSLGQLVAGIAHEINNPVNFIYANLEHLDGYFVDLLALLGTYETHNPDLDPDLLPIEPDELEFMRGDVMKVLASMRVGSQRIQEIVKSLKNFSRLDEATFKTADIHQGIDNTLMILHHRWSGKAGRVEVEIVKRYGEVPMVECCPGQLNQVFMNLLSNAIDALDDVRYGPEDGGNESEKEDCDSPMIVITTTHQPSTHTIQVAIADNGSGISPANQRKLFDPFFTTKPVGRGTGLGLAISHEVITKQHGGTIEVSSVLGEGTTFTVTLPVQAKPMV